MIGPFEFFLSKEFVDLSSVEVDILVCFRFSELILASFPSHDSLE